jgi:hypothetical protein
MTLPAALFVSERMPMHVVGSPNPDYPGRKHDNLWLLVGGDEYFHNGAKAIYLGVDLDEDRVDIAGLILEDVIEKFGLNAAKRAGHWMITVRALQGQKRVLRAKWPEPLLTLGIQRGLCRIRQDPAPSVRNTSGSMNHR